MNKFAKRILCASMSVTMMLSLTACGREKESFIKKDTQSGEYVLRPVGDYFTEEVCEYANEGIRQKAEEKFISEDGLCTILVYPDYYDVTLDYENATPEAVGAAYAKTILRIFPSYGEVMEPYIYENIRLAFSGQSINYEVLEERMQVLLASMPEEYSSEIKAFAVAIAEGEKGFAEDGKISYEEAVIVQMIPDALRSTACSALSLWGSKTETGKGITLRCLEWYLGSENQMGKVNAVVHMDKGDRSITSIGLLGILDMISAVNDDGVFVGILDVGAEDHPFVCEGKICYTYAIRYALEEFDNATDVGNYMVANSDRFTWCHNLIITDGDNSYCAEDCVREVAESGDGFSILRDADTPVLEALHWKSKDSLCVLNSFMTEGNRDSFSGSMANLVRFEKYNEWVSARERFSVADVKDMITQEKTAQYEVENVHRNTAVHLVLIDYATGRIQVAFTGEEGVVDKPLFLDVGGF